MHRRITGAGQCHCFIDQHQSSACMWLALLAGTIVGTGEADGL